MILQILESALVDFYRYFDRKFDISPIPPSRNNEQLVVGSLVGVLYLCISEEDKLKEEVKGLPLRKDVDDILQIAEYVKECFRSSWRLHNYKFFVEDTHFEDKLNHIIQTINLCQ